MNSQFHYNFQNQLSYSSFQEEPITKSMKDMIQTQNSITRPISRLDSIMSNLINKSEKSLSCQPLTNPYIPNSTDWTQELCHFRSQDSILKRTFELDQTPSYGSRLTFWQVIPFLKLKLNMKVIKASSW